MNRQNFCDFYWKYYKSIEKDFINTIRFVELDLGDNRLYDSDDQPCSKANSEVYSTEYVRLYLAICSEIDVVCKSICSILGSNDSNNMKDYTGTILSDSLFSDITSREVHILLGNRTMIKPFQNWQAGEVYQSPDWWSPYNNVKHNRIYAFKEANLKNVINALGGLYVLETYMIRKITENQVSSNNPDVPNSRSELFEIKDWNAKFYVGDYEMYFELGEYE